MSQQVMVNYQGVSIQVQAKCDTAVHSLCKIDKTLERIHNTADKLESSKVKAYEEELLNAKETIKKKIESFKATLEKYKEAKAYMINNHQPEYRAFLEFNEKVNKESEELTRIVNELTGSKLAVVDEMIDEGLLNEGKKSAEALFNEIHGIQSVDQKIISKINAIEDVSLRELAYQELLKNKDASFDFIIKEAQNQYDLLLGRKTEKVISEYKEELASSGIDTEVLDNVKTVDEAVKVANDAIVDEIVRKETLKVIIKAIKSRGFIVDTKNNLKIDKKRNVVKLVALKASGQMAEFEIQLNGKFMYHFDEYEGHACKKDITPFLEDLKNIYDINILHEEVTWENPDKVQMKKYQHIKENKGTN